MAKRSQQSHSLPNIRPSLSSDANVKRTYSLSLSHLRRSSEFIDYHHKPSPFNIRWIHGYNPKPGVINLNNQGSTTLFYAASYCGVVYNWTTNRMRILQGHRHIVTSIAADAKGRWLVTADTGPENSIIIWDTVDFFPQRTMFSPHGSAKLMKVAISADAKYLLTLAYPDKTSVCWWIWSYGLEEPHATLEIGLPRDSVMEMEFNPYNTQQFLLMTKNDIWIGVAKKIFLNERGLIRETNEYELKIRKVEKSAHTISAVAKLMCFTFVENTSQVLVGTSRGYVIIFGYFIEYKDNALPGEYDQLKFIKILKMETSKIIVIKSVDGVIVTGNNAGEIHFYDEQLKLLYWIHGFQVDSVRGLSFNLSQRSYQIFDAVCKKRCLCWEKAVAEKDPETGALKQKLLKHTIPTDATVSGKPFIVRDFIICTRNQGVSFVDFVTEKLETVLDTNSSTTSSLTVHPEKPFVCIGYSEGYVEMYNFVLHTVFARLNLRSRYTVIIPPKDDTIQCSYELKVPELKVTCIKYSPSGLHLACGLSTGQILFLDPTTIDILTEKPFQDTNYQIVEMNFSPDSLMLAFADAGRTVGVYKYDCEKFVWNFVGKHRSHYKAISTVFFLPEKNAGGDYKLLSLGTDRIMVEYDTSTSSEEHLEVFSLDRVEQTAIPLAGIVWPSPKGLDPDEHRNDLPTILIATDEYKYKIVNYHTTMTLSTVLGPRFDTPVRWMQLISRKEEDEESQYLVFATKNIIGMQKMPLDGNPWKHVALLAHPLQITHMCFREDLGVLFTIGDKDTTLYQWAANYRAPDSSPKHGGIELDPYYCLIENGRPGWLFQEIRDLFYYIQILCQGTFSPAMRSVNDYIPIDSLPDLMRALGYFPTEYEVENLIVEAKYKVYQRYPATDIDFEDFVKLYVNHRPAFGDNYKRIRNAFRSIASMQHDVFQIKRKDFIKILQRHGECFSPNLTWYLLSILSGHSFEDRATMSEDDFSFLPTPFLIYLRETLSSGGTFYTLDKLLSVDSCAFIMMVITFNDFMDNILGIQELDNTSEACSTICSSVGSFSFRSNYSD